MHKEKFRSILLIRLGGLGDLLVAFPSICLVRKKMPHCAITLMCRKEYGEILKETGKVDNLVSFSDPHFSPLFMDRPSLDGHLARWLEEFSMILGWMQEKRSALMEECFRPSERRICRLFVFEPDKLQPLSKYFFQKTRDFLREEELSVSSFSECTSLPIGLGMKEDGLWLLGEKEEREEEKIVVIHPGSGSVGKCWPFKNFLKLIDQFNQRSVRGVLVTGMAEERIESELMREKLPMNWIWLKNPPLLKLAGLLSCSSFYIGNDSGITHLAAACGTRGVALFRKDLEVLWKPFGSISVLSGNSMSDIKVDSVCDKISSSFQI